ncbi:MAG: LLM class flavin-dependent oxidoreductase, partial [Chloroflexi bacterium]|nr:LLM class flavin-dependent oxidoreductase [Chloroflexota bacterium]
MRTELSIAFQADRRPADYVALAQLVDGYAFDRVSVYNDLFYQPSLGPLLWMAPHLRRARLGPAALNPYLVHPVELAGQAALLDLASNGRAYLGLTRGAWLGTVGVSTERPLTALHEAVLIIRALLEGRAEGVAGRVYRLAPGARLRYAPLRGAVPIVLGTWGRATARLAGALADEIKVGGSANPAMVSHLAPSVAAGMASAARSADSVGICLGTVTVVDSDRELARARAR